MNSRILLINFTNQEASLLEKMGVTVERGFISDQIEERVNNNVVNNTYYFIPHPVYEFKVVIVSLNVNEELKIEFMERSRLWKQNLSDEFRNFWDKQGVLVIFTGDYKNSNLSLYGISGISLSEVIHQDETVVNLPGKFVGQNSFFEKLNNISGQIIMPTNKYVHFDESPLHKFTPLYFNKAGVALGLFKNKFEDFNVEGTELMPHFIVLPRFRNNLVVTKDVLIQLSKINSKLLPELSESDWIESEKYYPNEVLAFDEKIKEISEAASKEIIQLEAKKSEAKRKYVRLRGIIHKFGDDLKNDVQWVLESIWLLNVKDVDEEESSRNLKEDLIIDENNMKILVEVKGTRNENPNQKFIGQVWKHMAMSKNKDLANGALILNHDLLTDPKKRKKAYSDLEDELEEIIFIDTKVLFDMSIAIIDYNLDLKVAKEILLSKGRVQFNLEDYANQGDMTLKA